MIDLTVAQIAEIVGGRLADITPDLRAIALIGAALTVIVTGVLVGRGASVFRLVVSLVVVMIVVVVAVLAQGRHAALQLGARCAFGLFAEELAVAQTQNALVHAQQVRAFGKLVC